MVTSSTGIVRSTSAATDALFSFGARSVAVEPAYSVS